MLAECIIDILEDYSLDFNIEIHKNIKNNSIAIIKFDPAGIEVNEVLIPIVFDGTNGNFIKSVREFVNNFDENRQIVLWLKELEQKGINESVSEVEKEVKKIKNNLKSMLEDIENVYRYRLAKVIEIKNIQTDICSNCKCKRYKFVHFNTRGEFISIY